MVLQGVNISRSNILYTLTVFFNLFVKLIIMKVQDDEQHDQKLKLFRT